MNFTKKQILSLVVVIALLGVSFSLGMKAGQKGYKFSGKDFKIVDQDKAPQNVSYSILWKAIDLINQKYIDKPVDQNKILYGAISGAVAAVGDPYTTFFDPAQLKDFNSELGGSFDGIGADVGMKNGSTVIIAPLDESPAMRAGLLAGDIILKVDGADTQGLTLEQVVNKIRGPKGTHVKLSIYREKTSKQMDFDIVRETISVKSVKFETKDVNGKKLELISVERFGDDTSELFKQAANDAVNKKVDGIVLDLRDDPGGYLDTAVELASYWVEPGQVVVSEARTNDTTHNIDKNDYKARGNNILGKIPTIVLINAGSASAAEILSGALHDHGLAKLVGVKSFGKGSVQELVDLPSNNGEQIGMKITVAKWLTPNGVNINHNGLDPDVKVDRTPEQIEAKQDPQLDKAFELLK